MLATADVTSLYGLVFVQADSLGVASYHFDAEDDCYISYNSAPAEWLLDDGSKVPSKKPFTACSWDRASRTFRAVVEWAPTFNGAARWEYEITFADNFWGIVGGRVLSNGRLASSYEPPWAELSDSQGLRYLRWTPPPTTIYGSVYVQGFSYHNFVEGVASYHFEAEDCCYISYSQAPSNWQLADGSAPPPRKSFSNCSYDSVSRTFRATVHWDTAFAGAVRWEYELKFAEDFSCILDGTFRQFSPDGTELPEKKFGNPADEIRRHGDLYYVRKPGALMLQHELSELLRS